MRLLELRKGDRLFDTQEKVILTVIGETMLCDGDAQGEFGRNVECEGIRDGEIFVTAVSEPIVTTNSIQTVMIGWQGSGCRYELLPKND